MSVESLQIIQESLRLNEVPKLYGALTALFQLRGTLLQQPQSSEDVVEIESIEKMVGELIVYLSEWNGIHDVMGKLLLKGVVSSRGDVLRLAAPIYDKIDNPEKITLIPTVGIVGRISAGKGTAGEVIGRLTGSIHLPLSDRLRDYSIANAQFPPFSREELRNINDELKPRFGKQVFVDWTMQIAQRLGYRYHLPLVTIDGFRSVEEAQFFINQGGLLIGVETSDEIRFKRLLARQRPGDTFTKNGFDQSDAIEKIWIDPIFKLISPNLIINNNGNETDLEIQIKEKLDQLGITMI